MNTEIIIPDWGSRSVENRLQIMGDQARAVARLSRHRKLAEAAFRKSMTDFAISVFGKKTKAYFIKYNTAYLVDVEILEWIGSDEFLCEILCDSIANPRSKIVLPIEQIGDVALSYVDPAHNLQSRYHCNKF